MRLWGPKDTPNLSQPDAVTQPSKLAPAGSPWQLWALGLSRQVKLPLLVQEPGQSQTIFNASERGAYGLGGRRPEKEAK